MAANTLKSSVLMAVVAKMRALPTQSQFLLSVDPSAAASSTSDLSILLSLTDVDGGGQVETKPLGFYAPEKKKVLWKLGSISEPTKVRAQWAVAQRSESVGCEVRFINKRSTMVDIHAETSTAKVLSVDLVQATQIKVDTQVLVAE